MPVNPDDPRAHYLQIADDLSQQIFAGQLLPGQRLKSGRVLAGDYGVSPMTIQQAMRELRDRGLVVAWQGRGVFVVDEVPETEGSGGDIESLRSDVRRLEDRVSALEAKIQKR